jgi:hypothetical protein
MKQKLPHTRLFGHHSPNPLFSPDRKYIWDPYRQRWMRNNPGDGCLGLVLGLLITLALLKLFGVLQ